jgi:hypothetical protein
MVDKFDVFTDDKAISRILLQNGVWTVDLEFCADKYTFFLIAEVDARQQFIRFE